MIIDEIRKRALTEEVDYTFLLGHLSHYKHPHDKIRQLVKNQALIRVKRGLYVFGEKYAKGPYSLEVLANLIYGPSYISLEYALAFYGLIPERVMRITSITNKKNKIFTTPVGTFSYKYLSPNKYPVGVTTISLDKIRNVQMATKEKALADLVANEHTLLTIEDMEQFLIRDLRIDLNEIVSFNKPLLKKITQVYQNKSIDLLLKFKESIK